MEGSGVISTDGMADLGGAREILTEDGTLIVGGLIQPKRRKRGESEGRRRTLLQNLPVDVQQRVQLSFNRLYL